MSKVILHIGTHKTATTTIQDTFFGNAALLKKHGIVYPTFGKISGHHGLVHDWGALPAVYRLPEGSREAFRQIARAHAESDNTVFISSEEFSRADPKNSVDFNEVRALLAPFDKIEVICVLRLQWQFIQSVYLEVSKKFVAPRPPLLMRNSIRNGQVAGLWADYNGLLDRLRDTFEETEISFFEFGAAVSAPGGILGHMLAHMGSDLTADDLKPVNDGNSNVSPLSLASWAANILAEPKVAPPSLVERTTKALKAEYGADLKPCLFTRGEFTELQNHFDERNEVLRQRRAPFQPDFRLPKADASKLTLFRDDISSSFWLRLARSMVAEQLN